MGIFNGPRLFAFQLNGWIQMHGEARTILFCNVQQQPLKPKTPSSFRKTRVWVVVNIGPPIEVCRTACTVCALCGQHCPCVHHICPCNESGVLGGYISLRMLVFPNSCSSASGYPFGTGPDCVRKLNAQVLLGLGGDGGWHHITI